MSPEHISKLKKIQSDLNSLIIDIINEKDFFILYPALGVFNISQKFGENPDMYKKYGYDGHFGVDILTPYGTPILACDNGVVKRAGYSDGNGYFIELSHTWGSSLYLHFKEQTECKIGDLISRGETIGYAGNSGDVRPKPTPEKPLSGTHLHFSIKKNDVKNPGFKDFIDPLPYLKI